MAKASAILGIIAAAAIPGLAGAQPDGARRLAPVAIERAGSGARWPDSITCHFPTRPAVDAASGLSTGKTLKPFTQIARLTLAPAIDGKYYYSDGPITDVDEPAGAASGRRDTGLKPGALLAFNPDGSSSAQTRSDCNGHSIAELIASGQAR